MAHSLHHGFGSVHLFLLSLALCSHTIAALSALLEKWAGLPTERYPLVTHANMRLGQSTYFRSCTTEVYENGRVYAKGRATIPTYLLLSALEKGN